LKSINFVDGAEVKKGDVLFVIEQDPYLAALAAANASKKKAEASLALAIADLERTVPLVKRGALSAAELDAKNANKDTADADVASAAAAVTQAQLNLDYTKITAPISGRIGRHLVDLGNLVQSETTILTTIESVDSIHAYFNVSESDVLRMMELRRAEADSPSTPPTLTMGLANDGAYPYQGTLDFSELGVDSGTGTQQRRAIFNNADRSLVPGLFVRLRLPIGKPKSEFLVSERAIASDQRGNYVYVVNGKNVVEYRPVKLGAAVGTMRVVLDGVKSDEWIVVNGLQRSRPGAPVDPQRQEQMAQKQSQKPGTVVEKTVPTNMAAKPSETTAE
jgi:RND family efflux transporter MFP subunit